MLSKFILSYLILSYLILSYLKDSTLEFIVNNCHCSIIFIWSEHYTALLYQSDVYFMSMSYFNKLQSKYFTCHMIDSILDFFC